MNNRHRNGLCSNPQRALRSLGDRTAGVAGDPGFVDRVMAMVRNRELDWGWFLHSAARRCIVVCGLMVVLAVWWALQSRELVPFAFAVTENPLELPW
jgi:hypothetical protein